MGLCLTANEAGAAPAPRASTNNYCTGTPDGSGHVSCALGAAAVLGDTILACGRAGSSYDVTAVSDGTNGSYTLGTQFQGNGNVRSRCAWFINAAAGTPTIQFTFNNVTGTAQIDVVAISGVATTGTAISETGSTNLVSASTLTCASATATAANQILWGYLNADSNATSIAPNSSETELHEDPTNHLTQFEYKLTSGAGSVSASWALGSAAGAACNAVIFDIAPATPASFDSGPTFAKVDGDTYRMTYDTANATTAYVAAYPLGTATPTAAALIAGTGAHGTANEVATNGADTLDVDVTDSPAFPAYEVCGVAAGAGGNSAVTCNSAVCLDPPSNFQFVNCSAGLTSIGVGSPAEAYNASGRVTISYAAQTVNYTVGALVVGGTSGAYGTIEIIADFGATGVLTIHTLSGSFQNGEALTDNRGGNGTSSTGTTAVRSITTGDIEVVPTTVSPSGATLTVGADGQYSYTATGRQTALNGVIFDSSIPSYLTLDLDFVANDAAPTCSLNRTIPLVVGVAMTAYDVSAQCADGDNDTLTYGVITNNLPTGLTLNATTGHITGTPTASGDVTVQILALDGYGGTGIFQGRFVTSSGAVSPDCMTTPTTLSACENSYLATFASTVVFAENPKCSGSVDANNVISTSPTKNTQIPFGSNISITYSVGSCEPPATRMVNCLRKTLAACQTLITAAFGTGVTLVSTSSCPAGYPSGKIWTQSPGPGRRTPVPANLRVNYCP
jgi:hypothetical protein